MSTTTTTTTMLSPIKASKGEKVTVRGLRSSKDDGSWSEIAKKPYFGPVTQWMRNRLKYTYYTFAILGSALWFYAEQPWVRVLGAGLAFPGSGFLALSRWFYIPLFALNLIGVPVSIFLWWLCGPVLVPLLPHFGSAALAAWFSYKRLESQAPFSYTLAIAWIGNLVVHVLLSRRISQAEASQEKNRVERNQWLKAEMEQLNMVETSTFAKYDPNAEELTPEQIKHFRYLLNLCLQPLDQWKGFTTMDQFREGAYRYQLYHITYALSCVQNCVMPNFHGYLGQAQQNAIAKVIRPESLYYWIFESTWGRLSLDWDPIENDNIMVTGWYLCAIAMYMSASGDMQYMEPGSLVARVSPFHKYPHSVPSMIAALMRNWKKESACLYPCEPNWTYTTCNAYGAVAVQALDRILSTRNWPSVASRYTTHFINEFTNVDGDVVAFRSSHTGMGVHSNGSSTYNFTVLMSTLLPSFSRQQAALFRKELVEWDEKRERPTKIKNSTTDYLDAGNYRQHEKPDIGKLWALNGTRNFGDLAVASTIERELDASVVLLSDGRGGVYAEDMSTLGTTAFAWAKLSGPAFWSRTVLEGPPKEAKEGPLLKEAPYPDVLVAKARSHDGLGLELVLYAGSEDGKGTAKLGLARLRKGKVYEVQGKTVTAGWDGEAEVEVKLDGRTVVEVKLRK